MTDTDTNNSGDIAQQAQDFVRELQQDEAALRVDVDRVGEAMQEGAKELSKVNIDKTLAKVDSQVFKELHQDAREFVDQLGALMEEDIATQVQYATEQAADQAE